jgi:hypothetical protein
MGSLVFGSNGWRPDKGRGPLYGLNIRKLSFMQDGDNLSWPNEFVIAPDIPGLRECGRGICGALEEDSIPPLLVITP